MDWDQIVRENASGMLRLAVRIVASSADAEELVQDAFLKAYQYQQSTEVVNWGGLLHRFVVNCGARPPAEKENHGVIAWNRLG